MRFSAGPGQRLAERHLYFFYNGTLSRHLKFVIYERGDIRVAVKHSFLPVALAQV